MRAEDGSLVAPRAVSRQFRVRLLVCAKPSSLYPHFRATALALLLGGPPAFAAATCSYSQTFSDPLVETWLHLLLFHLCQAWDGAGELAAPGLRSNFTRSDLMTVPGLGSCLLS